MGYKCCASNFGLGRCCLTQHQKPSGVGKRQLEKALIRARFRWLVSEVLPKCPKYLCISYA